MYVVLIGPPGSGKGTQSQRLCSSLDVPHLSTGDMLREAMRQRTPVGKRVEALMLEGGLVSDRLIMDLVAERLAEPDCHAGCLFDGVPRTRRQAEMLDELLRSRGLAITAAVEIDVPDEELTRRILNRAQTENRPDDNLETLQRRLEIYRTETMPILQHYRQQSVLRTIDGEGEPDDIFDRILQHLPCKH